MFLPASFSSTGNIDITSCDASEPPIIYNSTASQKIDRKSNTTHVLRGDHLLKVYNSHPSSLKDDTDVVISFAA
jgi:hypothetical protein